MEIRTSRFIAGKRVKRFFAIRSEAEAAAAVLVSQIKSHGSQSLIEQKSTGAPLSAVLATFRKHRIGSMTGGHLETATYIYKALEAKFGTAQMDCITPLELEKWLHSRGNSSTTGACYFRYVRLFWRWAYKKQLIEKNTIDRVDAPFPNLPSGSQ